MDYEKGFVMQKSVNWSLLNQGLPIPVSVCELLKLWDPSILEHGVSKPIKILIDGELYDVDLKNQNFDLKKFVGHRDIIQIRYSPGSLIAAKLSSLIAFL